MEMEMEMEIDVSLALARFWGLFYLIFGALFIITHQLGRTIAMTDDDKFVIATGYSTLLMGLITVSVHNLWVWDWRLLITLLGWMTLLKSVHKIGFPESIRQRAQRFKNSQHVSALVLLLLGAWLTWKGFF